jgi:tetratricopeptide (TPR) repeat protein
MKKIKKGMFWHVHHDKLIEYCYNYDERVECIKNNKPKDEIETRLRLFKPVKGKLPKEVIEAGAAYAKAITAYNKARAALGRAVAAYDKAGAAYDKAWAALGRAVAAYDKARAAYDKAWAAFDKAWATYDKTWATYEKAWATYEKARAAYDKAGAAYYKAIQDNMPAILKLHAKECPNCTWDGNTIHF